MKIGWTKDLQRRMSMLQVGNPESLMLIGWTDGGLRFERLLHEQFKRLRLKESEWFRYEDDLVEFVEALISKTTWLDHIDGKIQAALETSLCEASKTAAEKCAEGDV